MKVRAKIRFRDIVANKIREPGEMFTVTDKRRCEKLVVIGFVEHVTKEKEPAEDNDNKVQETERR